MDKKSTSKLELTASLVKQALKKNKYPSPSVSSLEFIKNFARNFKSQGSVEGDIRDYVLN